MTNNIQALAKLDDYLDDWETEVALIQADIDNMLVEIEKARYLITEIKESIEKQSGTED
ncbi:MAG: hypothetical protein KGV50_02475 [Gammaproteobacteria bacterium]|nr:hypothetical protein [Gammaproteobacteria bacterium]